MVDLRKTVIFRKQVLAALAIVLVFLTGLARGFDQATAAEAIPVAAGIPPANLLADTLAGRKATGDVIQVAGEKLSELVADKAAIYREYHVAFAASRQYGPVRVDVFQTQNQFAAFGLFLFNTGPGASETPVLPDNDRVGKGDIGSSASRS